MSSPTRVAIVGTGIIGMSWALVFARAGLQVRVHDTDAATLATLPSRAGRAAEAAGAISPAVPWREVVTRIQPCVGLADALDGAAWVQECVREKLEDKAAIFEMLDRMAMPDAILASSTSSFGVSRFAADLPGRARCVVVHPATPPHLLPVVEIVGAPFTAEAVVGQAFAFMHQVGQVPVRVNRETPGFVMNRLQGALLLEMFRVIGEGTMTPGDVDRLISDGFGLRWAFLGPLAGIDLNAPGGIADYLRRYGFIFDEMAREAGADAPVVTDALIGQLDQARRAELPLAALPGRTDWRDHRLAALRALRAQLDPA